MSDRPAQTDENEPARPLKRILVIGESDSCGAAGVQGDLKTVLALGGYAMTAVSALSSHGAGDILSIKYITPSFVEEQIVAVLEEVGVDAVKVGFLHNEDIINIVSDILADLHKSGTPIVVDPSIVSRSDKVLVDEEALSALKRRLYIHTTVLTPNLKEAEALGVMQINDIDDMRQAADMTRTLGVENVVLKGGQVENHKELYFVATPQEERIYERPTVKTPHTLGAGNVLSSALAVNLSRDMDVFTGVEHALDFLHQSIVNATAFNEHKGPVNHAFDIQDRQAVFHPEEIRIYKT